MRVPEESVLASFLNQLVVYLSRLEKRLRGLFTSHISHLLSFATVSETVSASVHQYKPKHRENTLPAWLSEACFQCGAIVDFCTREQQW